MINDAAKLIALMQGSFLLGFSMIIMYYYFTRVKKFRLLQLHLLLVITGNLLLTLCTMISIFREKYLINDIWFWACGIGYLMQDISLYFVWKIQIIKRAKGDINGDEENKAENSAT